MRIPFNQLRFSRDSVQTWGLQIRRWIQRRNELDQWAMWGKTESGGPNRFGHLEGIRIAHSPRDLELMPYAMGKIREHAGGRPAIPSTRAARPSARVGLDLKYLLTPNLTLDATFNPGLRAGRGRSRRREPLGVRDVLFREAAVLRVRLRRLRLRFVQLPLLQQRVVDAGVLLAPDRARADRRGSRVRTRARTPTYPRRPRFSAPRRSRGARRTATRVGLLNAVTGQSMADVQRRGRHRGRRRKWSRSRTISSGGSRRTSSAATSCSA